MARNKVWAAVEIAHVHCKRFGAHCRAAGSAKRAVREHVDMIYHCNHADEEPLNMPEAAKDWVLTQPAIAAIIKSVQTLENVEHKALLPQIDELKQLYDDKCWTHSEMRKRGAPVVIGVDYGFAVNPQRTNANDLVHFVKHYELTPAESLHEATAIGARHGPGR